DRDLEAHRGVVDAIGDGAPPLLERMRLRFLDQKSIEENAQTIAMTLVRASDVPLLIDSVRRIMKQGMGQKWSKVSLQRELESLPLEWVDHPSGRRLAETFAMVTREFIENVRRSRLLPRHLDRPEESALASAALSSPPGSLVLVHGAPGSGKSEVLAGLVAPARLSGAFVLAMSAEMVGTSVLPENVHARLRSLAGETKALLVIDQVDQLARG